MSRWELTCDCDSQVSEADDVEDDDNDSAWDFLISLEGRSLLLIVLTRRIFSADFCAFLLSGSLGDSVVMSELK